MLKLSGALLIISACGIWGFLRSKNLRKRSENLLRIMSSLTLLENEISYGQKDIKGALLSIGTIEELPFFTEIAEKIGAFSIHKSFDSAISKCDMGLLKCDKQILLEFSQSLGALDAASQIKSIAHTRELLRKVQEEAYDEYKKYGRLYRNIGILLGIFLSLILV